MPFYIRKSVSAGPFRFNLSKGGIGASVGVKGLRLGAGPRGHYVHAGRGGIYYRASLNPKASRTGSRTAGLHPHGMDGRPQSPASYSEQNVEMLRVSSGDVLEMQDERYSELLAELNAKQASIALGNTFAVIGIVLCVFSLFALSAASFWTAAVFTLVAYYVGKWLDSFRRCSVLMYDLEDDAADAYERLTQAFDALASCRGKWHVDAGGAVRDLHTWKRNAGASHLLDKRPTDFTYALPSVVKSNVTPPALKVGKEMLYLFPDVALVVHADKIGAVGYDSLRIQWQDSNFIEDGDVPSDTTVLYHTWKHPNKSGGPDRRFANNYQIPVCRYESIYLTSTNGLNELLQVSRAGVAAPLASAVSRLSEATGSNSASLGIPRLGRVLDAGQRGAVVTQSSEW